MNGDERLRADLQRQVFAGIHDRYDDALALITVFAEHEGKPTIAELKAIIGGLPAGEQVAMTTASRLGYEILQALTGSVALLSGEQKPCAEVWRSILEYRTRNGYGNRTELFPPAGG